MQLLAGAYSSAFCRIQLRRQNHLELPIRIHLLDEMKTVLLIILVNMAVALAMSSCSTAGYVASRSMEKTGHVVAHGGEEIAEHTR